MNEMQNALSAGKEVTVHQSPINQSGWTGSGYIITDPATGAGAYKISGGANGAFVNGLALGFAAAVLVIAMMTPLAIPLAAFLAIFFVPALFHALALYNTPEERACFLGGAVLGFGIASLALGGIAVAIEGGLATAATAGTNYWTSLIGFIEGIAGTAGGIVSLKSLQDCI
jgi:hypothetical protein